MCHVASNLAAFPYNVRVLWTVKHVSDFNHDPTLYGVKTKLHLVQTLNLK